MVYELERRDEEPGPKVREASLKLGVGVAEGNGVDLSVAMEDAGPEAPATGVKTEDGPETDEMTGTNEEGMEYSGGP